LTSCQIAQYGRHSVSGEADAQPPGEPLHRFYGRKPIVKTSAYASLFCIVAVCGACTQGTSQDDRLATRVEALETDVAALDARTNDLMLKNQITSSLLFRSPLDNFFQSPEFWENTYDSDRRTARDVA
jgi:hypothetical protein